MSKLTIEFVKASNSATVSPESVKFVDVSSFPAAANDQKKLSDLLERILKSFPDRTSAPVSSLRVNSTVDELASCAHCPLNVISALSNVKELFAAPFPSTQVQVDPENLHLMVSVSVLPLFPIPRPNQPVV